MWGAPCNRREPVQFLETDTRGQQGLTFAPLQLQEAKTVRPGKPSSRTSDCLLLSGEPPNIPMGRSQPLAFLLEKRAIQWDAHFQRAHWVSEPQFKTRIVFYRDIFRLLYGVSEAPPCIGLNTSEMPNQTGASEVDQVLQNQSLL